ncbi:hypothetical protein COCNU_09G004830 [Cocos nucifera]|uniref:Uncharacterized protein n=1 Tax=Cocos nucifera TaxID=13894 RepID=A0A8K0N770_COCNU|nr:hypothetical protein COCNU_09G004830 [Cocos nucifera]
MPEVESKGQRPSSGLATPDWISDLFNQSIAHHPGKAPASSTASKTPTGLGPVNIQVPLEGLALTNPILAKWLIKTILLLTDRKSRKGRTLDDMFSSFYTSLIGAAHDMVELDRFMRNFTEVCRDWKNKVVAIVREKEVAFQHLQAATIKIKEMEEVEKKKDVEISCLKAELESAQGDYESAKGGLESAQANLESAMSDLDTVRAELGAVRLEILLLRREEETIEWIIETQESHIQRKRCEASWLPLEEFRGSEDFKKKLITASHLAYRTGYEDGRDAVGQLYPDLDLTLVLPPDSNEGGGSADDVPTDQVTPNEVASIGLAAPIEPPPTEEEMASAIAVINAVVVDD